MIVSENFSLPTTLDTLLNGRLTIEQPANGYRVAIDPIFLAAAIPAKDQELVLDIGTGVGAAALCLAARVPGVRVTGLEIQKDLVRLATANIRSNSFTDRIEVIQGSLTRLPPRLAAGSFHHVMANPPYMAAGSASPSPTQSKAMSHMEMDGNLAQWINFAYMMTQPKGTMTFIHRADRLDALLTYMRGKFGDIVVFPLWPGASKPAKRIIVQGRKHVNGPLRLSQGIVLHEASGKISLEGEQILRGLYGIDV